MRGIAILMVVLFHARVPWTEGGFAGVDVFFVLSGFLISGILIDEVRTSGRVSLTRFWARRARRLVPAATATAIASLGAIWFLASPFALKLYAKTAIAFGFYGSNLLFVLRQSDYFATKTVADPLLHTWTLGVEEQFYFLFAPLTFLLARASGLGRFEGFRRATLRVVLSAFALGIALNLLFGRAAPLLAFYTLPFRAWEFAIGAILATWLAGSPRREFGGAVSRWCSALGLLGLLATTFTISEKSQLGALQLFLPTLSTAALIFGGRAGHPAAVARLLESPLLRMLGRWSYSWYLWHWPVLVALSLVNPRADLTLRLAAAATSLALAAASFRWIENPVRTSRWLAARQALSLGTAAAAALLVCAISLAVIAGAGRALETDAIRAIVRAQTENPRLTDGKCHLTMPEIDGGPCVFGDSTAAVTVVLFGDSHAEQWFPAVDAAAQHQHWRLVSLTKSGCPSVDVEVLASSGAPYPECTVWRKRAIARIVAEHPILIMITNRDAYNVTVRDRIESMVESATARLEWQRGLRRLLASLAQARTRVLVVGDPPAPGFDVPICLSTPRRSASACDGEITPATRDSLRLFEAPVVRAFPNTSYVDLTDLVCGLRTCPAVQRGSVVWRDDNHLSVHFASQLMAPVEQAMLGALGPSGKGRTAEH